MTKEGDDPSVLEAEALRPFRRLALAVVVLPLALFCAGAGLSLSRTLDEARTRVSRLAQVVHEHGQKVFEAQALVMDQAESIVAGLSDAAIRAQQADVNARLLNLRLRLSQVDDVRIIGADGILLAASRPQPLTRPDYRDRDVFKILRDNASTAGEPFVSDVRASQIRNQSIFIVARRRLLGDADSSGFSGIVLVTVSPDYFRTFYADVARTVPSSISLFRGDGDRLARYPDLLEIGSRINTIASFLRAAKGAPDGGVYDADDASDGRDRIVAYQKLSGVPVYVGVGVERATVIRQWAGAMAPYLILGASAVAILLALVRVAQGRMLGEGRALARLRAETARREETEAQLRQSQKMDAIGRLTGGIAHDFNNLLTVVSGSLDLIGRRVGESDPRLTRLLANARDGASRAATLTRQLLAFARRQPLDPRPTDTDKLVTDLASLLQRTLGESITVETVLAGDTWPAMVDPPQLENALVNLAVNARDAMRDGGRITIRTANAIVDVADVPGTRAIAPGQYVMISVTDTGIGIAPDILDQVTEPFFTTKPTGQGTGLGLSQVFGFVRQSGGNVTIDSEVGVGTIVRLYLPRYAGTFVRPEDVGPVAERPDAAGGVTILVAEDDADVRVLTAESLTEVGYRVVTAENGADALNRLAHEPDVRLLLTDVVMPVMDGRALADAAHKMRPELPVVFMTGYTPNAIVHDGTLDRGIHLLTKPFTLQQLTEKVENALAEIAAKAGAQSRAARQ